MELVAMNLSLTSKLVSGFAQRENVMTKYITVKLTEDQTCAIIRDLEYEMIDRNESTAFEQRIVNKLHKALLAHRISQQD